MARAQAASPSHHRRGRRRWSRRNHQADVTIVWEGGAATGFVHELNKTWQATTEQPTRKPSNSFVASLERYDDRTIAAVFSRQGRRTGTGLPFTKTRVENSPGVPQRHRRPIQPKLRVSHLRTMMCEVVSITAAEQTPRRQPDHAVSLAQRRLHRRRATHLRRPMAIASTTSVPSESCPRCRKAGSLSIKRPEPLGWPARPCCTRSNAVSSRRSTSTGEGKGLRIKVEPR